MASYGIYICIYATFKHWWKEQHFSENEVKTTEKYKY